VTATTLVVPTGRQARLLYGLCRRGPAPEPVRTVDGWDYYDAKGHDGGSYQFALRAPARPSSDSSPGNAAHPERTAADDVAEAGLRHCCSGADAAFAESVVVLSRLLELAGRTGLWHWQRVVEVLRSAGARPGRHNKPVQELVALFERARFNFSGRSTSPATWTQLVVVEVHHNSSRTVHLDPAFQKELASVTYEASVETFLNAAPKEAVDPARPELGERRVTNPEGVLPSRWARVRSRLRLMLQVAPSRRGEQPRTELTISLDKLVIADRRDADRLRQRRHVRSWAIAQEAELARAARLLRIGALAIKEQVGSILGDVLEFRAHSSNGGPSRQDVPSTTPAPRARSSNGAPPPQDVPSTRPASRAPP
jgi:hypothetical protein